MSAIPGYKDIVDLIKKGATFEAQEKIMELREACMTLENEVHTLKKTVRDLEEALRFKEALSFQPPFYFMKDDAHPFCPRCWEKDRRGIHIGPEEHHFPIYFRQCPECKHKFKIRDS
jgi:hypothetical protein